MKLAKRLQSLMLGASLLAAGVPSWAVIDSPGGPAVRQLTFAPPVTRIAEEIYSLHTGKPVEDVSRDMERDFFLSPDEAKEYGIIDSVIAHREVGRSEAA